MRKIFWYGAGIVAVILGAFFATNAYAAEPTNSGLLISPPRYSMKVKAGSSDSQKVTIANYTKHPLDVTINIQEFSVANLSYEYEIKDARDPWLYLEKTELHLKPSESDSLKFVARPPANTAPGGKYYLIVASAVSKNGDLTSTIQVAAPVYITISGKLDTSSRLSANHGISQVVFGNAIPFHLDVENLGNVHFLIDVHGSLKGLTAENSSSTTQHIILPSTTRRFNASIPAPFLPGIYQASYGYSSDSTGDVVIHKWIVYLPPWSIIGGAIIAWASIAVIRLIRKRQQKSIDSQQ